MIMKEYRSLSEYFRDLNNTSNDPVPVSKDSYFFEKIKLDISGYKEYLKNLGKKDNDMLGGHQTTKDYHSDNKD